MFMRAALLRRLAKLVAFVIAMARVPLAMTAPIDKPHPDLIRLKARVDRDILEKSRDALLSQAASLASWLVASALAINGAGILSVAAAFEKKDLSLAAALFGTGLLLSMLAGLLSQRSGLLSLEPINRSICLHMIIEEQPELLDSANEQLQSNYHLMLKGGLAKRLALAGSIALFFAGAATFSLSPDRRDLSNERRCLQVQTLMLEQLPARSDWPAVFQALGCRPQGKGSVYAPLRRDRSL